MFGRTRSGQPRLDQHSRGMAKSNSVPYGVPVQMNTGPTVASGTTGRSLGLLAYQLPIRDPFNIQKNKKEESQPTLLTGSTAPTLASICRQDPTDRGRHENLRLSRFSGLECDLGMVCRQAGFTADKHLNLIQFKCKPGTESPQTAYYITGC